MKATAVLLAVAAVLVAAGQAGAANYKVLLGEHALPPAGTPKYATLDQFFPKSVTINAGDSVTFSSASFHTATYTPTRPPFIISDPAKSKYASMDDEAGNPFFFAGHRKLIYNGLAAAPLGPKAIKPGTPSSTGALSPSGPKAPPATATFSFPTAGTYKFLCTIHPGMTGLVVVKPSGAPVPKTPSQVQAQALQDVTAAWAKAKADDAAAKPPANTVYMGYGNSETLIKYYPDTLTVKAGTTVTFVNRSRTQPHNIGFGPKKYIEHLQKTTDLMPTGPTAPNQVSPFETLGSDPPSAYSYDGTNHGNGFFTTPVTVTPDGSVGGALPHAYRVKFTKPGTYKYFCWIHGPDMAGKIVVTK
jgi:plastocyanin